MMSLRLSEGSDIGRYKCLSGAEINTDKLSHLRDLGLVEVKDQKLRATTSGRPVLNGILRELLT
jgi:oxygen-independent coproporphyrinogen-3 oxidase